MYAAVHLSFAEQACRWPHRTAVAVGDARLSYADLAGRVAAIRDALTGLPPGPVAGYFDHSGDGVAAFLAVLGTGHWYVPLAPAQGSARIDTILADSAPVAILTDLPTELPDVIDTRALTSRPANPPATDRADPGRLAYAVYTSGSTGIPKGVAVGHHALAVSTAARRHLYGDNGGLFLAAPFCFDSSLAMFGPLTSGGAVVLASATAQRDPVRLAAEAATATHLLLLPSVYGQLLDVWGPRQPAGLAVATVAGEAATPALVRRHFTLAPDRRLVNEYGPTEATVFCTAHECVPADGDAPVVPIGVAVPGYRVGLFTPDGQPAADGDAGEIWVAGPALAHEYLGNPKLTADRFIHLGPDRWYRTGDLGRRRPDGTITYHGRTDDQVKIRGIRVELTEIDALLEALPGVAVAVSAIAHDRLTGFLYPAPGIHLDPKQALRTLRATGAADFLVPHALHIVDTFPRTAHGKIDRRALAATVTPPPAPPAPTDLGGDPLHVLLRACAEVTGVDTTPGARFLAIGGDSLAAMRVGVRLHMAGLAGDPMALLTDRTLADIAATLRPRQEQPVPDVTLGDLSPGQHGVWFTENTVRDSTAFLVPLRLRLDGRLDPRRLATALRRTVHRHPVLGCRITESGGRPTLMPAEQPPALELIELQPGETFDELAAQEAAEPIDLRHEPPLRTVLLRGPETDQLLLTLHHLAFDGWSKDVLLRDLAHAYTGEPAPAAPADFREHAAHAYALDVAGVHHDRAHAAARLLRGFPPVLSLRGRDTGRPLLELAATIVDLPPALHGALADVARRRDTTMFTVLLAGFACGLRDVTGQQDMVIGTVTANRYSPALEQAVGMFTNVVAVALRPGADPVGHAGEQARAALRYADVPFHRVVQAATPPRDPHHAPLVQVLFEYFARPTPAVRFGAVTAVVDDDGPQQGAVCDLSLRVFPRGDGLRCVAVHDASVVDDATAQRVMDATLRAWHTSAEAGQ
jgi:amino acid adenylation domain-containing protein